MYLRLIFHDRSAELDEIRNFAGVRCRQKTTQYGLMKLPILPCPEKLQLVLSNAPTQVFSLLIVRVLADNIIKLICIYIFAVADVVTEYAQLFELS